MLSPLILTIVLQARDLSFLAYLDVWIISGLILLAVAVVTVKWLRSQWRRRNEADERDYYDGYDPYYDREPDLDEEYDDYRP